MMELKEAIQHLEETLTDPTRKWGCEECKAEHVQLLLWLEEYEKLKSDYRELLEDYEDLNKQLRKANRTGGAMWIPCNDRMPDKDGDFICVSNGEIKILPYSNGEFYSTCFDAVYRCCNSSVTYWMPIPNSPKGGTK